MSLAYEGSKVMHHAHSGAWREPENKAWGAQNWDVPTACVHMLTFKLFL